MQDLMVELRDNLKLLDYSIMEYKKRGAALAKAEHAYKVANAKLILLLRSDGIPVTIIQDLCKGDATVSELRLRRDIAQSEYESLTEGINVLKLKIRVISGQIDREWKS